MKSILFNFALLLTLANQTFAQVEIKDGLYFNKAGRQVWIVKTNGAKLERGLLWKVDKDSVFVVITNQKKVTQANISFKVEGIAIEEIDEIKTNQTTPGKRGLFTGMTLGFIGGLVGASVVPMEDPPPKTYSIPSLLIFGPPLTYTYYPEPDRNVFGTAMFGMIAGGFAGTVIGLSSNKKFEINGSQKKYEEVILELDKRAYWNRSSRPKR